MNTNEIDKLNSLPVSGDLTTDVHSILTEARQIVVRTTNTAMTTAYWLIGKRIVEEEQKGQDRASYGELILKKLSKNLTGEIGNGFSYANLKNMRQFYKTYMTQICYTVCSKLLWSHNILIMRNQDSKVRE